MAMLSAGMLGRIVVTPGVAEALERNQQSPTIFIRRHVKGYWGELDQEDIEENQFSLVNGFRLLSQYTLNEGTVIWIITEADRLATTILLPSEY